MMCHHSVCQNSVLFIRHLTIAVVQKLHAKVLVAKDNSEMTISDLCYCLTTLRRCSRGWVGHRRCWQNVCVLVQLVFFLLLCMAGE